jgi:long-chain fatty acid transport protein
MKPVSSRFLRGRSALLLCGVLAYLAGASPAPASGTRVGFKDAFATARGNAFVATADNPSALYYNPAGLAQLDGTQISANLYSVAASSDYSGPGRNATMDNGAQNIPALYVSWKPQGAPWTYGLGVYAPFGLSTNWPDASPLRTFALKNEQTYRTCSFSLAYQFSPEFSVGGSFTYNKADADLRRALGLFGPGDLFRFEGSGHAFGGNLGLLWKPSAQHSFGLSYTLHTDVTLSGTSSTIPLVASEPASAGFAFPETLIVGWSYRPIPEWNLEVNLDWTNWNRLRTVTVTKPSGNTPLVFNWQSGLFYEFGATRFLSHGWLVSGGYCFTENSTPDATYTPAVPDSSKAFYSLGVGYHAERFSADLAWQYGDGGHRHVAGSPLSLTGATADGTYANSLQAVSLSLGLRF